MSVRRLVQMPLVLLLLASGRRISEILGISGSSSRKGGLIFLDWLPGFRAKHDNRGFRPSCPSISAMGSERLADSLLCPVRAFASSHIGSLWLRLLLMGLAFQWVCPSGLISCVFSEARVLPRRSDVCPWGSSPSSEVAASYCRAFLVRSPVREMVVFPQVGLYVSLRPL